MTDRTSESEELSSLVQRAAKRGFSGLMLDGVDLDAAIAASTDTALLTRAIETASRGNEKIWAERFARRICEYDARAEHRFEWAALLASVGNLDEARRQLADPPAAADERYRRAWGILCAKDGRIDEAMAVFDTLPDRREGVYPAPVVLSTAYEMISECDLADTKRLVDRLSAQYPSHVLIRGFSLRCHLYLGDLEQARRLAQLPDSELQRATAYERRSFAEAAAEIYEQTGWTHHLFDFVRDRIVQDPTHWALYGTATNAARVTSRDKEYADLVSAIPSSSRNAAEAVSIMFRWHLNSGRIEEAARMAAELRPMSAQWFLNADLFLKANGRDRRLVDEAYEACRRCRIPLLGPALGFSLHAYYYDCSAERLKQSLAKLEPFVSLARTKAVFWQIYLRCLVGTEQPDKAEAHYRALPAGLADSAMLKPFSMFFAVRRGQHDGARRDWTQYIRTTRHICVNARSSYPTTIQLKYTEKPDAVLVFLTIFNGAEYLDWFLDHYRALGVDHFFITDNGSNDGTLERLKLEPDVSVFFDADSFAKSGFAVLWTNHLMQRFGVGHWCFHVDLDEGFVFPGCDNGRSLKELLAYCDDRGFGLVPAIAVDMYPESLDTGETNAFAASRYFDVDYSRIPVELPPYFSVQGGIRRRLTGVASSMHKSPLIRMAPDARFIECSHSTTHLPVCDVSGALLHYKFVGDVKRRLSEAISRGEHFGESVSYRRLSTSVSANGGSGLLLSPASRRYTGTASLLEHGLLKTSEAWGA